MNKIIKFIKQLFYKTTSIFYVGATDILKEPLSKEQTRINYELRVLAEAAKDWCEDEMEVVL